MLEGKKKKVTTTVTSERGNNSEYPGPGMKASYYLRSRDKTWHRETQIDSHKSAEMKARYITRLCLLHLAFVALHSIT